MNRIAIAVLSSIALATPAVAATGGVADSAGIIHLGAKLGPSNVRGKPSGFGIFGGYTIFGPNTFKENNFLSKVSIAAEGEYVDLGNTPVSATATYKASTFGVVGAATYPINAQFAVIAKAGLASITRTFNCGVWCDSSSIIGLHGGAAGQYNLSPLMSLRAGYDFYPDGYSMMSASALYKF